MEDRITQLKAEIFDLQVTYGQIRKAIEDRINELNKLANKNSETKTT